MGEERIEETEEILSNDDILFLRSSPQFGKLIQHLQKELDTSRLEVDDIKADGLPALQGRIFTLKSIINLFGDIYYA